MPAPRAVPLAWCNLTHDRVRFALFATGIAFAVVLMGVQMGIRNALIDGNCRIIDRMTVDLVLVHPYRASLIYREGVSRRTLDRTLGVPGVEGTYPFYIDYTITELASTADPKKESRNPSRTVRAVGYDPDAKLLDLAVGDDLLRRLYTPGTALFDVKAKPSHLHPGESVYGPVPPEPGVAWPVHTEFNGRSLTLVGGFELGTDFAADGTLVMDDDTFVRYVRQPIYPFSPDATADLGLIRVVPGADPVEVRDRLRTVLGATGRDRDVDVLTKAEFRDREAHFWLTMTPIGFVFAAGMALGFVVGTVICYQILASDVADHLGEYATLRAIGYSNRYLSGVVLQEAAILAVAGFVPGMLVTAAAYAVLGAVTGLPIYLTPSRAGWIFVATVVMCVASGLLALRKAQTVDPANVF